MRRCLSALLAAGLLCVAAPAALLAEDNRRDLPAQEEPEPDPSELAREGAENLLRALELFIQMIPQFKPPEMTEEGDIIIRRKNPEDAPDEEREVDPESDSTRT